MKHAKCSRGHLLSPKNTVRGHTGIRICLKCRAIRKEQQRLAKRAKAEALRVPIEKACALCGEAFLASRLKKRRSCDKCLADPSRRHELRIAIARQLEEEEDARLRAEMGLESAPYKTTTPLTAEQIILKMQRGEI